MDGRLTGGAAAHGEQVPSPGKLRSLEVGPDVTRRREPRGGEQAVGRPGPGQGLWGGTALTSAWRSTELAPALVR